MSESATTNIPMEPSSSEPISNDRPEVLMAVVANLTSSARNQPIMRLDEQPQLIGPSATISGVADPEVLFQLVNSAMNADSIGSGDNLGENGAVEPWAGLLASVLLLVVCLSANVSLIVYVKRRVKQMPRPQNQKRDCNVANLLRLIAGVSLCNGCLTCLVQISSFLLGDMILSNTFCKILGLSASFMSLLIIWYKALLGFERYLKFVKPQEHFVTFSKVNVQIIVMGVSFVLMSAVSGPIYGWGDYAYMKDIHSCSFDLGAPNAVSYFILSSLSYVAAPYLILCYSCFAVLLNAPCSSEPLPPRSASTLERKAAVVAPLASHVVLAILFEVPMYVLNVQLAMRPSRHLDARLQFAASWLQTFAINACLACSVLVHRALAAGCQQRRRRHLSSDSSNNGPATCLTPLFKGAGNGESSVSSSGGSSSATANSNGPTLSSVGGYSTGDEDSMSTKTGNSLFPETMCPCLKGALRNRSRNDKPILLSRLNSSS